jgi:hypothetical protein
MALYDVCRAIAALMDIRQAAGANDAPGSIAGIPEE